MTPVLLIETTIKGAAVGVCDFSEARATKLLWQQYHAQNVGASAALTRLVAEAYQQVLLPAKSKWAGVVVSTGPGSFTGIKVGLAFAQGFVRGCSAGFSLRSFSGLGAATWYYHAAAAAGRRTILVLPATASFGFVACYDPQLNTVVLGCLDLTAAPGLAGMRWQNGRSFPLQETVFLLVGKWDSFAVAAKDGDISYTELTVIDVVQASLLGATQLAEAIFAQHQAEPVEPLYLRLSTPEERMQDQQLQ